MGSKWYASIQDFPYNRKEREKIRSLENRIQWLERLPGSHHRDLEMAALQWAISYLRGNVGLDHEYLNKLREVRDYMAEKLENYPGESGSFFRQDLGALSWVIHEIEDNV